MKKSLAVLSIVLAPILAHAQVEVVCKLHEPRVLQYEPVIVTVEVANNTLEPMNFMGPDANAVLAFDVEKSPGEFVQRTGAPLSSDVFAVKAGQTQKFSVNLISVYRMTDTGPYTIRARVEWGSKAFLSQKVFVDVDPGLEIGRLVGSVPGAQGQTRTYMLRTLTRNRGERVFLRIDDEEGGRCYGVLDLGGIVRLFKPVMQVDQFGNIHVLHQSGPDQFTHSVFTADGNPVSQEQYTSGGTQIRLGKEPSGQVSVEGAKTVPAPGTPAKTEPDPASQPVAR